MASILRQIVAGPRARHPEAGLDLCYVTDYIVVTSGPSSEWPRKAYRNPVDQLVAFLDKKHGQDWCIFEFRAEGTGYPDSEVYGRIQHFPWPDHHPPPFAIMPNLLAAMRDWIKPPVLLLPGQDQDSDDAKNTNVEAKAKRRVAVVHCKAGKGRSGTVSTSYLISEEGWKKEDALERFTSRRMRAGFGPGVSIPSQLRYVEYVDRWANQLGKKYIERAVEIVEVHIWGLFDGVKVAVEGYVDGGKSIENYYTFTRDDKTMVEQGPVGSKQAEAQAQAQAPISTQDDQKDSENPINPVDSSSSFKSSPSPSRHSSSNNVNANTSLVQTVIFKPPKPLILPTSDINIDLERRNRAVYTGFTVVTSIAHVWFNAYFEGGSQGHDSGVFEINWDAMDGIKGTRQKGFQALDRLKVVWRYADGDAGHEVKQPQQGQPVPAPKPADWQGSKDQQQHELHVSDSSEGREGGGGSASAANSPSVAAVTLNQDKSGVGLVGKDLGLRLSAPDSANVSHAPSIRDGALPEADKESCSSPAVIAAAELKVGDDGERDGVKTHIPQTEHVGADISADADADANANVEERETRQDTKVGEYIEVGLAKVAGIISKWRGEPE